VEVEAVRRLPVFDTGIGPKLECTVFGIRGGSTEMNAFSF